MAAEGSILRGSSAGRGLGLAGGARGVGDGQAETAIGGFGPRLALDQRLVAREAGDVAPAETCSCTDPVPDNCSTRSAKSVCSTMAAASEWSTMRWISHRTAPG